MSRILRSTLTAFLAMASVVITPAIRAQGGTATTNDPRVGLKAGLNDAGVAAKGMSLVSHSGKADSLSSIQGLTFANSDLAFSGNTVIQGNFSGFIIWDVSNPTAPVIKKTVVCPTDQGDPSVWGKLLFISVETTRGTTDCGLVTSRDSVVPNRARGVRIYDISDLSNPKRITVAENCRGSHTHTLVEDPKDKRVIYIYMSGSGPIRSASELAGCSDKTPEEDPNSSRFRIDVVRVPLAHPEQAKLINSPRLFDSLENRRAHGVALADTICGRGRLGGGRGGRGGFVPPADLQPLSPTASCADSSHYANMLDSVRAAMAANAAANGVAGGGGAGGRGGRGRNNGPPRGPEQCHDITAYPAIGLAAGACGQYGLLFDIKDVAHPKRVAAVSDSNFAFWHSATFSNDGSKLLFTDEWGGGTQPKCRVTDPLNWGGDALFSLKGHTLTQGAYYKIPQAQTSTENCVAHNGGLVPIPGRDILVQGWYQGGISIFDFSDINHPKELAYFDRGPVNADTLYIGGFWGAYYYNGLIYASEIARGFDIFELTPTADISPSEIAAAKLVHFNQLNPQDQPKIVWPAAFPVVRSYLDQLVRENGLDGARTTKISADLDVAEKATGAKRRAALTSLASALDKDTAKATDVARVRTMAAAVRDLAKATK
jgi:hypothetical protein